MSNEDEYMRDAYVDWFGTPKEDAVIAFYDWLAAHDAVVRNAALEEAAKEAKDEILTDNTGHNEDTVYNQAITDAVEAILAIRSELL